MIKITFVTSDLPVAVETQAWEMILSVTASLYFMPGLQTAVLIFYQTLFLNMQSTILSFANIPLNEDNSC